MGPSAWSSIPPDLPRAALPRKAGHRLTPGRSTRYRLDMITCGGCGRIDAGVEYGVKLMCGRCCHLQVNGPEPPRTLSSKTFLLLSSMCLLAMALAGLSSASSISWAEDLSWFIVLTVLMLANRMSAAVLAEAQPRPAHSLLYLPLGVWAYLWRAAPGMAGNTVK